MAKILDSQLPASQQVRPTIALAATFTAEPLEKSLSFWLQELGQTVQIQFAPYHQVFQELLNPSSLLANNQNGVNVILIRFEDWENQKHRLELKVPQSEKEDLLARQHRHTLPSQIEVAHLNRYETEYLYQEIFIDQVYARHGVVLKEDACVIDVGANIGLFTLFIQQKCPQAKIYAFEPAPKTFQALKVNAKLYCQDANLFNCGLSGQEKEETFVFYPRSSVFSGFAADVGQDQKAIRSVIVNILQKDRSLTQEQIENLADEFLAGRLEKETYQVQLKTLSNIIEEQQIQQIDLLKLDAEKSELAILEGIQEEHWPLIQQIITEVHDQQGETLKAVVDLLEAKGFTIILDEETLLQGSGLYRIYASRPHLQLQVAQSQSSQTSTPIEQTLQELVNALRTSVSRGIPHVLCICPPSVLDSKDNQEEKYQYLVEWLEQELKDVKGLNLIKPSEILQFYPIKNYYDPYGDELGHIPFTSDFYHILGTIITRKIHILTKPPFKVIVLDCDQTIWKGISGEDGVAGLEIDESRRILQELMVAQQKAGKILCLCSKNVETDVWDVFDYHSTMPLQKNHLVSWRINWQSKSENIRSLSQELQLGLDSFIFIDDNPLECAEVRVNCPDVLTLQIPEKVEEIPNFLSHIWAFDGQPATQEDQKRTELYRQNVERERLRQQSMSFQNFIEELDLKIEFEAIASKTLDRVAQLTQRTNQFNATTIRRNEVELQKLLESGQLEGVVVQVKDRFGDYGKGGVLLYAGEAQSLRVDTFLLSCRVLGRGVEHQMLCYLGKIAQEKKLEWVDIPYFKTQKNQPILAFLQQFDQAEQQATEQGFLFRLPTQAAVQIALKPELNNSVSVATPTPDLAQAKEIESSAQTTKSLLYQRIATELAQTETLLKAIRSHQSLKPRWLKQPLIAPLTFIEKQLVEIWTNLLQVEAVGIKDNYFELDGTSLQAVELFAQIEKNFGKKLPLTTLLECPTIKQLAERISRSGQSNQQNSLIQLTDGLTQPPLFLVHDGDGEVLLYRNLAQSLQPQRSVYGIRPYTQEGYPMLHTRIPEMAAYYIKQMREIQPVGPYLIGGMCAGGVIAFEMAIQLQQQGQDTALLAIIDAADVIATKRIISVTGKRLERFTTMLTQDSKLLERFKTLKHKVINLITYETQTRLANLSNHLKMILFRSSVDRQNNLPSFLQNLSVRTVYTFAEKDYHPTSSYQGEIALFRATEGVGSDEPYVQVYNDPLLGWGQRTTQGVKVFDIPGGHSSMLQEPNAQVLAQQMQAYLDAVLSESHPTNRLSFVS